MGVKFQWLDGDGERIAAGFERSPACRQPGKLANLAIREDVHARQGPTKGTYRYAVLIHNNGKRTSPRTKLELRVDGAQVDVRPIGRLAPGERRTVRFVGPACKREVKARLDPKDAVREITEADNVRRTACDRVLLPG
jgi:subtilase family serine protease